MHKTLVVAGCVASLVLSAAAADAKIVCREGFQVVNGHQISTPYCNDNYVAQVARQHGFQATDSEVRNNPAFKNRICRWVGSDPRIREYCDVDHGSDWSQ